MNQRGGPIAKTWAEVGTGGGGGGGGLADGDYGDITVSGGGTAMSIDNNAVTYAMMPDLSASEIYGSEAGGDPEPLGVTAPLYVSSGKLSTDAMTRPQVASMIALGGI